MSKKKLDPYAELGVGRDASAEDVRRAYKSRSKRAHPDAGGSHDEFVRLNRARALLEDPAARARYDETGEADERRAGLGSAMQELAVCFMNAVREGDCRTRDVAAQVRRELNRAAAEVSAQVDRAKADGDKWRDAVGRVTVKGSFNLIAEAMMAEARAAAARRLDAERRRELIFEMLRLLDDVSWRADAPPESEDIIESELLKAIRERAQQETRVYYTR